MLKKCISKGWKFTDYTDGFKDVDLPHDYAVTQPRSKDVPGGTSNGFYPDRRGKYIKYLTFNGNAHYILDVDGAYMCSQIFLNENHLALHPYGYTPFLCDLTPYINSSCSNKLVITTNPLSRSTRWYSGNGIYRDVFLWEGGDVRIEPRDMFIYTVDANEACAKVNSEFKITSDRSADIKVRFTFSFENMPIKTDEICLHTEKGKIEHVFTAQIDKPKLWSTETPDLYTLKTEIFENETLLDTSENQFGIRTIYADAEKGLLLNGKSIKLRGGCIHHDHGGLGAAAYPAAEERKIRLLKEAGFNAIRTAHNPPSLALLECCDRLGMIVMDEAFDCWNKGKNPSDYHLFFSDWCLRDISYMVLRDRNHPSVFSYSIGNEILEIDGSSDAAYWSKLLSDEIRKYDRTRFVTSGIQKGFVSLSCWKEQDDTDPDDYKEYLKTTFDYSPGTEVNNKITEKFEEPLDISGCNYYYPHYEFEHEAYPNRILWGSETHAITFFDSWALIKKHPYILGDFTWTAFDNLGEVGAGRSAWGRDGIVSGLIGGYPWRSCWQGDLDLCGFRLPRSYFREAIWIGNTEPRIFVTHPEHFGEHFSGTQWHFYDVDECWTFDDKYINRPIKVETYTDAETIEWFVNGKKIGSSIPEKGIASIDTVYEKGSITAVAYKNGIECSRYTLCTTGSASAINITPEKNEFSADNRDLCYFDIIVTDAEGRPVTDFNGEIKCTVYGCELVSIFSADPLSEDIIGQNTCHAFKGRAVAVVKANCPGCAKINVYADDLAAGFAFAEAKLPAENQQ